jgi:hypothetical protein
MKVQNTTFYRKLKISNPGAGKIELYRINIFRSDQVEIIDLVESIKPRSGRIDFPIRFLFK